MGGMIMKLDPNREFWNPKIELMSRYEIRDLQFKKLKKQLKYNCRKSPFYKERFDQAGLKPEDVRTREDFQYVPTFSPRVTGEFRIFLDVPGAAGPTSLEGPGGIWQRRDPGGSSRAEQRNAGEDAVPLARHPRDYIRSPQYL